MGENIFTFEPSGGLLNASLVMMDKETDSHWSIITEEAIWGDSKGTRLEAVPGATKTTWADWKTRYPATLVLSINGKEHEPTDYYEEYYANEKGFRGLTAKDGKLSDKAHIFAFHWDGEPFAVPQPAFFDGGVVRVGDREVFLYREADDSSYQSTTAFVAAPGARFEKSGETWRIGGAQWSAPKRTFEGAAPPEVFHGFDTFWYIWSLTNDDTEVLEAS